MEVIMNCELDRILANLIELKPMLPGSICEQYNVCGKPNCRCKDKINPRKHGPQSRLNYSLPGKNSSKVIKKADVAIVRSMTDNFKHMRELISAISVEAIRIYRDEGAQAVHDQMEMAISHARAKLAGEKPGGTKQHVVEVSRDKWKAKAQERIVELQRARVTIKNLTDSRNKWRTEAMSSRKALVDLKERKHAMEVMVAEQTAATREFEEQIKKKRQ